MLPATKIVLPLVRGFGQVVFCDSWLAGLCVAVALLIGDYSSTLLSAASVAVATAAGAAIEGSWTAGPVQDGLYGFNAQLVGMAFGVFSPTKTHPVSSVLLCLAAAVLSAFVAASMGESLKALRLPYLTLPFNIAAILVLGGAASFGRWDLEPVVAAHLPVTGAALGNSTSSFCIAGTGTSTTGACAAAGAEAFAAAGIAFLHSISQIFLVENAITGALILLGLLIQSRRFFGAAVMGSAVAVGSSVLLGASPVQIRAGLWGYNSVLTAIAIGGGIFVAPTLQSFLTAVLAVILTVLVGATVGNVLGVIAVPGFTVGFCLTTMAFLPSRREANGLLLFPSPPELPESCSKKKEETSEVSPIASMRKVREYQTLSLS